MVTGGEDDDDDLIVTDAFKEGTLKEDIVVKSNTILTLEPKSAPILQETPQIDEIEFICLPWLGVILSILLTLLLASIALCLALSCWRASERNKLDQTAAADGPGWLPHPGAVENPMIREEELIRTTPASSRRMR